MSQSNEQLHLFPRQQTTDSDIFLQEGHMHPKYLQLNPQVKNEEDCQHIQITSPTQNLVTDLSTFVQEEKRKCVACFETERKLSRIEHELQNEKKKNVKYLKIINTKVDKEKELQRAYCSIAKELKKKIDAASSIELYHASSTQKYEKEQVYKLRQQVSQLKQEIAEKYDMLKNEKQKEALNSLKIEKLQKLSQQYVNRQQNAQQSIKKQFALYSMTISIDIHPSLKHQPVLHIIHIEIYPFEGEPKKGSSLGSQMKQKSSKIEYPSIDSNYCLQRMPIDSKLEKEKIEVQNFMEQKYQDIHKMQYKDIKKVSEENILEESQVSASERTVKQWESERFYSVEADKSKSLHSLLKKMQVRQSSILKQIQMGQSMRQGSFYSIASQQRLQIAEISNVTMKNSFSNPENDRKSEKQILKHLISEKTQQQHENYHNRLSQELNQKQFLHKRQSLQAELRPQLESQRQKTKKFALNVRNFIKSINQNFNSLGSKYKVLYQLPQVYSNHVVEGEIAEHLLVQNDLLEEILPMFLQQFQKIMKSQKREYEKLLNDKQLALYDFQNKYNDLTDHKKMLEKMIQNYQMHKSLLEIKLLELQEKLQGINEGRENASNHTIFATQLRKKVSLMIQERTYSKEVQCEILPTDLTKKNQNLEINNHKLIEALNHVPHALKQMLTKKAIEQTYSFNFEENLKLQVEQMLKSILSHLHDEVTKQPEPEDALVRRIRSASLSVHSKTRNKSDNENIIQLLQTENQHMKTTLKQRASEILKYSEKITLHNVEKSKYQHHIEALKTQIHQLKQQLQEQQCDHNLIKNDSLESINLISPNKRNGSQTSQFMEYEDKKQYNNLYWDRDVEVKELKQKIEEYELQLTKFRLQSKKKKKIIYISN